MSRIAAGDDILGSGVARKDRCVQDGKTAKKRPLQSQPLSSLDSETTCYLVIFSWP